MLIQVSQRGFTNNLDYFSSVPQDQRPYKMNLTVTTLEVFMVGELRSSKWCASEIILPSFTLTSLETAQRPITKVGWVREKDKCTPSTLHIPVRQLHAALMGNIRVQQSTCLCMNKLKLMTETSEH